MKQNKDKQIRELERRIRSLERNETSFGWILFCSVGITISVLFILSFPFADYYTEVNEFNYSCKDIKKMIILDDFPDYFEEIVYFDTFWWDGLVWDSSGYFTERDFKNYYIENCEVIE